MLLSVLFITKRKMNTVLALLSALLLSSGATANFIEINPLPVQPPVLASPFDPNIIVQWWNDVQKFGNNLVQPLLSSLNNQFTGISANPPCGTTTELPPLTDTDSDTSIETSSELERSKVKGHPAARHHSQMNAKHHGHEKAHNKKEEKKHENHKQQS